MSRPRPVSTSDRTGSETTSAISRRRVIGAIGTGILVGTAGCTVEARDRSPRRTLLSETASAQPGRYESFRFTVPTEQWVTVSASLSDRSVDIKNDGPGVDVVVMTPDQFSQFQDGDAFEYIRGVSMPDVTLGRVSSTLDAGEYVLLVDNTPVGRAESDDASVTAVVNLEITASPRRKRKPAGIRP